MFFLSEFGRGKDKKKRKYKLGSLSVLTTVPGLLVGGLQNKNRIASTIIGGGLGYGVGKLMDKSGKFEDYNKAIHNQRTLDRKKNKYFY